MMIFSDVDDDTASDDEKPDDSDLGNISADVYDFPPLDLPRLDIDKMTESELEAHDYAMRNLNHVLYDNLRHQFRQ